jgi:hypothetical protein
MKTVIKLILIFLFIGLIISCEENNNKQLDFVGKLISNSTCKNDLKSTTENLNTPDSLSCVDYTYDDVNNKLTIKHINAGFNCCPDSLYCDISLSNDMIIIEEYEKTHQCDCNCLYDLDIEINGVDLKIYQVKLIEPYSGEQAEITFEIDLVKDKEGSYCVTRKQYPWGMISQNE